MTKGRAPFKSKATLLPPAPTARYPVGREIARGEALRLAQEILTRAEQARTQFADLEASRDTSQPNL